jgi:hypothetical protein
MANGPHGEPLRTMVEVQRALPRRIFKVRGRCVELPGRSYELRGRSFKVRGRAGVFPTLVFAIQGAPLSRQSVHSKHDVSRLRRQVGAEDSKVVPEKSRSFLGVARSFRKNSESTGEVPDRFGKVRSRCCKVRGCSGEPAGDTGKFRGRRLNRQLDAEKCRVVPHGHQVRPADRGVLPSNHKLSPGLPSELGETGR